jgi:hypothetical protein
VADKKLSVVITGDAKGAQHAFSSVSSSASSADSKLSKVGGTIGKVFKGIAVGGAVVGVGVAAMVKGGLDALIELERIGAQTEAVIKSTGGAAGRTAEQISGLAQSMEKATGVEQELIQQGQNMLLTFTNIQGTNFDAATQTMLDMSVAMGTDASTTAIQLGKALNDPIKGISALSKVGVTFTAQQKEQIKAMVEAGDTAGAQKVILAELNKEFGGSAAAFGDTTAGKVAKLKNAFGDLQEAIAARLLPAISAATAWLQDRMPGAIAFVEAKLAELAPTFDAIGSAVTNFASSAASFAQSLVPAFEAIAGFVKSNPAPVLAAVGTAAVIAFTAWAISASAAAAATLLAAAPIIAIGLAVAALAGAFVYAYQNFEGFRVVADAVFAAVKAGITRLGETIQQVLTWIKTAWAMWGDELLTIAAAAWEFIRASIENAMRVVQGVIKTVMSLIHGDWAGAWDGIKEILGGVWAQIRNVVSTAANALRAVMSAAWDAIKALTRSAWEGIKSAISTGINNAVAAVRGFPGKVLAALGNLASTLYNAGRELIGGLVRGIQSAIPSISSVLSGVTNMIPDWKGPAKKDRTLLFDNGVLIMDGLLDGLVSGTGPVEDYLGALTEAIPTMAGGKSKGPSRNGKPILKPGNKGPGGPGGGPAPIDIRKGAAPTAPAVPVSVVDTAPVKASEFDLTDIGQILERQIKAHTVLQKSTNEAVLHLRAIDSTTKTMSTQLAILGSSGPVRVGGQARMAGAKDAAPMVINIHPNAVRGDNDIKQIVDGINKYASHHQHPPGPDRRWRRWLMAVPTLHL